MEEIIGSIVFALVTLLAIAALIFAVGMESLDQGIVIAKEYDDPDMIPVHTGKAIVMRRQGERFLLTVQGENEKGETITDQWSVTEAAYNMYDVGDFIVRTKK